MVSTSEAMIKHLKLEIAKLRRDHYGHSAERRARLIDQMELQLEELEAAATEDEITAGKAKTTAVVGFERRRPARKPFPEHLPRERVVIEARCFSAKMSRVSSASLSRNSGRGSHRITPTVSDICSDAQLLHHR